MTKEDFISRTLGKQWSARACCFDAMDCWGLCVLFYRHVRGIELHHTKDYESGHDFLTCFQAEVNFWKLVSLPEECGIFVAYIGCRPVHVGLILEGKAFHSRAESSSVRFDKIRTIEKLFTRVEYYAFN